MLSTSFMEVKAMRTIKQSLLSIPINAVYGTGLGL